MRGMKPVEACSCSDLIEADMLIEALHNQGISAYRQSKGSGDYMNLYMGTSVFGETIYVDEEDLPQAKEIIERITLPAADDDISDEPLPAASPMRRAAKIFCFLAALLLLLSTLLPSLLDLING